MLTLDKVFIAKCYLQLTLKAGLCFASKKIINVFLLKSISSGPIMIQLTPNLEQ